MEGMMSGKFYAVSLGTGRSEKVNELGWRSELGTDRAVSGGSDSVGAGDGNDGGRDHSDKDSG